MSSSSILDLVLRQLASQGPTKLFSLLAMLPELAADPHGADILRLLLRLDRRLCLSKGRWSLAAIPQTPEQRIVASTQTYLDKIPGGGAMIKSVVAYVAGETNYDRATVRTAILHRFVNHGQVVRNKQKDI